LRPSGKIEVDGEIYDAIAEHGLIEKNTPVVVTHYETGQLYCAVRD
jgi:membrane-bound serine protease (ClpP class)